MLRMLSLVCAAIILLSACHRAPPRARDDAFGHQVTGDIAMFEAMSLLGQPLHALAATPEVQRQREHELLLAQEDYDRDPHDEDAIIWLGRRLAYLGRYREAIDVFANGLAIHPDSHRLHRHRGHRWITLRKFDLALNDLRRAAHLTEGVPDEVEPDGQPNTLNIPTSTSHTNIFYHLGLTHYLRSEFAQAKEAYQRCMSFARNDDMRIATAYWLFLTHRRLGEEAAADDLLRSIDSAMQIIENATYHRLLLVFKGTMSPEQAERVGNAGDTAIDRATLGYGLGMRLLLQGDRKTAEALLREVIHSTNWAAFGHIAAEVELARWQDGAPEP